MNDFDYEYVDYDINKCIRCINKWMKINSTQIATGKMRVNSMHIEKKLSENVYYPDRWSFRVNYSLKQ